jgi:hypothetical protein
VGLQDWNWRLPVDPQDVSWDCAACSTAWALRSIGRTETEADVVAGLGPARISPAYGLLDASGAGLVSYLGELGIGAANNPAASWQDVQDAAGFQPMVIGGRAWCHWVAVRLGSQGVGRPDLETLWLMNSAAGWMNVWQTLSEYAFEQLGSFSAVWFTSW